MLDKQKNEETIFKAAVKLKTSAERMAYVKDVCSDDSELLTRVVSLLRVHSTRNDVLDVLNPDVDVTLDSPPTSEGPGTIIGRYKLLERIGEGGFGAVWAAEQKRPVKRRVALKIIKHGMDTKQVVARFEAERQALALMDHPNIAKVLDAGATDTGRPYFVMELVKGIPIIEYCDQEKCPTKDRLDLFIKVCHAIQHAHQKGIIHRDIKPSNILITLHDGVPVPRVIDFGIAKATQQELTEKTIYTLHHQFIGTPVYMSPEQAEMSGLDIDTRSDIYSLGVLLYELLTGRTPFDEKELLQSGIDAMRRIIREKEPPRPSTRFATLQVKDQSTTASRHATDSPKLISSLQGDLDWIVMKCLEKDRKRRYDTANGLTMDITRYLSDEPVSARPPTALYQLHKAWRRNRVMYTAAGLVLVSLVLGISLSVWQAWVATDARKDAEAAGVRESELRQAAQDSERRQRLNAYAADMSLAQKYLNENNLGKVDELLRRYEPKADEDDVRGMYWRHLSLVSKGQEIHTFPHKTMVRSISLSSDGARLASHTMSGKVRLYDVDSRRLLREYGGGLLSYGAQECSVALASDGRLLAAEQQGTLKVWDAASEELVFEQEHVVAPISFSPDSQMLAGATETGLRLWHTADWTSRKLTGDAQSASGAQINALAFSPDSKRIIFSPTRFTSKLVIYNLTNDTSEGELTGLDRPSVIATDGALVAAGGRNGMVCLWDLGNRERLNTFKAHSSIILGLAFSPDGKTLLTGGNDSFIKLWDTKTLDMQSVLRGHHGQIWNLKFSGDGRTLASASMDHSVKLWAWNSLARRAQRESAAGTPPADSGLVDVGVQRRQSSDDADADQRMPSTHLVMPGDSIQAAIDTAVAGDRIEIAAGLHEITDMIVVKKALTIGGTPSEKKNEPLSSILRGAAGLPFVLHIETGTAKALVIHDLKIEAFASGIQHASGSFALRDSRVIVRAALDFKSAISLEAVGSGFVLRDSVIVDGCALLAKYAGDTIEGTPPDIDLILASSGSRYAAISVTDCEIVNEVPNAISNGIETRSTSAQMTISGNDIRCQGIGILLPNHIGAMEIRDNTIWSTRVGMNVGTESPERSHIIGNRITIATIDGLGLQAYPLFLQDYVLPAPSRCIGIGQTSAGVTAGFFQQEVIGRGTNFLVEKNVLAGNPQYGISLADTPEPESYGPPVPNDSHANIITRNDFTGLQAQWDIAFGTSTYDNQVFDNEGVESIFRGAGINDRNNIRID